MTADQLGVRKPADLQELLGYLNYSSGTPDPQFLRRLNALFGSIESASPPSADSFGEVGSVLQVTLEQLAGHGPAFQDIEQAQAVLWIVFEEFPARYREFHRDLVFHLSDAQLWRPFFVGRVMEAILQQGGPWDEDNRIIEGAIAGLNDYVGHRPVAVLRTAQRMEPYEHEWIRPIPLFVRGAGVSVGRYQEVVARALDILRGTDPDLLAEAYFDPDLLDELALDPRAYDFDHPVNKRPNYHFGQWDPHQIDNRGRYRRFVAQQVTLDVLLERVDHPDGLPREESLLEAAAVLCGTMLMASGTSGNGPDAHDSTTTLSTLLPRIAAYRDAFYDQFVRKLGGEHGRRLRAEAVAGAQPLAGARQHLNQQLARRRAAQLEHVHLALLFARMGYPEAALRQAQIVSVAAARMACEAQCRLTTGHLAIDAGQLEHASGLLVEIEDFLHRAIECGAMVDPWNILGFQGQFSLFPSPENSAVDHRVDQLVKLLEQIFALYARLWSEAATHDAAQASALADRMAALARWWDQFAPTSVPGIEAFSGAEACESAREVADSLAAFRQAGSSAGNIAFWRKRVAHFESPKAYALVAGALLEKPDLLAAMGLLMQWLSQAGLIALRQGEHSFHALAQRWMTEACEGASPDGTPLVRADERPALLRKFFELLEANAEDFWQVPGLDLLGAGQQHLAEGQRADLDESAEDDDGDSKLFSAAYDDMVYIDSTNDGVEADMLESGGPAASDLEMEQEARRLGERLAFLRTVASLWKRAVLTRGASPTPAIPAETVERWLEQATNNQRRLSELLRAVERRPVPAPSASRESLLEFDQRRGVKEMLLDRIVAATIDTADAVRWLRAALVSTSAEATPLDEVLRAIVCSDRSRVERLWPGFIEHLRAQPLLYVPLAKGGDPARMTQARVLHQALRELLECLPKLGLLKEACQLIETARLMESAHPAGPGAISEFDRLFAVGYEAIVEAVVAVSRDWPAADDAEQADNDLTECLEQVTESLLKQWLAHSRTLRLSVLEKIADDKSWQALVGFIQQYGSDLFTQRFLNMGNLRAILHQGVDVWLTKMEQEPEAGQPCKLLDDLGNKLPRSQAVRFLSLVIEAVVENYNEYRDYNSTTTQSDRGELLYTLLDFLRLRVQYDRVAWHLKPVLIAHSILVRRGRNGAAEMWRRALAERTGDLAGTLQNRCAELRKKYAMRLPTVADRLAERFTSSLAIDRVRAQVKPAMDEVRWQPAGFDLATGAFALLEQEIEELTQEPTGVGLDIPAWLMSLEQEVGSGRRSEKHLDPADGPRVPLEQAKLALDDVQRQLTGWELNPH